MLTWEAEVVEEDGEVCNDALDKKDSALYFCSL